MPLRFFDIIIFEVLEIRFRLDLVSIEKFSKIWKESEQRKKDWIRGIESTKGKHDLPLSESFSETEREGVFCDEALNKPGRTGVYSDRSAIRQLLDRSARFTHISTHTHLGS